MAPQQVTNSDKNKRKLAGALRVVHVYINTYNMDALVNGHCKSITALLLKTDVRVQERTCPAKFGNFTMAIPRNVRCRKWRWLVLDCQCTWHTHHFLYHRTSKRLCYKRGIRSFIAHWWCNAFHSVSLALRRPSPQRPEHWLSKHDCSAKHLFLVTKRRQQQQQRVF